MTSIVRNSGKAHCCVVCNAPTEQRCSGCHLLYYCGKPHSAEDWKGHKPMCKRLQDTSLSTVSIPTPKNTFEVIAFPANEDAPRMITIEWEWASDEDEPIPWQRKHVDHLFRKEADIREQYIYYLTPGSDVRLPDDRCLAVIINDRFLVDGSPLNRCIFNLTEGKAGHPWCDNVLALRQRPQDMAHSRYSSGKLEEDLMVLKNYFLLQYAKRDDDFPVWT